ncbi:MAG: SdrD B-like domain-containing protein [Anaerolineae bacterium]
MRKRLFTLSCIICFAAVVLAPIQPKQHTFYLPLLRRPPTTGIACQGQILGIVYEDINGDGRRSDNEVGLPAVRMTLRAYNNPHVTTMVTNDGGQYLTALSPGQYQLQGARPGGYQWTTPHAWGIDIICATIQLDFGLAPLPSQHE